MLSFTVVLLLAPLWALAPWALARGLFLRLKRAGQALFWGREILLYLFLVCMLVLLGLLLWPSGTVETFGQSSWLAVPLWRLRTGTDINFVPFHTVRLYFRIWGSPSFFTNILGNIFLFSPLGFCLPLFWRCWQRVWKVGLMALAFPCFIEVCQLFIGRKCDIDDVLLNFLGILFGYGLWRLLRHWFARLDALALPAQEK